MHEWCKVMILRTLHSTWMLPIDQLDQLRHGLRLLPSFPTRRSSDLFSPDNRFAFACDMGLDRVMVYKFDAGKDRKSTRLNSSHLVISYAVFCLKKERHH